MVPSSSAVRQHWAPVTIVYLSLFPSAAAATVGEWVRGYGLRDDFTRLTSPV